MPVTINGSTGITDADGGTVFSSADIASQAQVQAGTDNTTVVTPLRLAQAATRLASGSVSNAANLDISLEAYRLIGYTNFRLTLSEVLPATSGTTLQLRVSNDNGTSVAATNYRNGTSAVSTGSTAVGSILQTTTGTGIQLSAALGNTANKDFNAEILLFTPSTKFSMRSIGAQEASSVTEFQTVFSQGIHSTTNVNFIRLLMASGNISTANWFLEGLR